MKIYTSYFYKIRFFEPYMIPVSTCISDPAWFKPPEGKEYFLDKRGVICGLRYEPLIIQKAATPCVGAEEICAMRFMEDYKCPFLSDYELLLHTLVDYHKTIKAFNTCANKMANKYNFTQEPIICLMVYEAPNNPCSERKALQNFFHCEELTI